MGVFQAAVTNMLFSLTNHSNKKTTRPHTASLLDSSPLRRSGHDFYTSLATIAGRSTAKVLLMKVWLFVIGPPRATIFGGWWKLHLHNSKDTLELHGMPGVWSYFQNICPEIVYGFTGNYNLKNPNLSFSHDISIGTIWHTVILQSHFEILELGQKTNPKSYMYIYIYQTNHHIMSLNGRIMAGAAKTLIAPVGGT